MFSLLIIVPAGVLAAPRRRTTRSRELPPFYHQSEVRSNRGLAVNCAPCAIAVALKEVGINLQGAPATAPGFITAVLNHLAGDGREDIWLERFPLIKSAPAIDQRSYLYEMTDAIRNGQISPVFIDDDCLQDRGIQAFWALLGYESEIVAFQDFNYTIDKLSEALAEDQPIFIRHRGATQGQSTSLEHCTVLISRNHGKDIYHYDSLRNDRQKLTNSDLTSMIRSLRSTNSFAIILNTKFDPNNEGLYPLT